MFRRRVLLVLVLLLAPMRASVALAQTTDTARLIVTVLDPVNAAVPSARVAVSGLEDVTRRTTVTPVISSSTGTATFEQIAPGRYTIQADMAGFNAGVLRDVTLRPGDNRQVIVLTLKAVNDVVDASGGQENASARATETFGVSLARETIATLSDDPAELQRQLLELAGADAVIRVDSFEGGQLPPKSLIKSVHVTRDQFAAEAPYPGNTFVDVITQAGSANLTGTFTLSSRATRLAGASPFVGVRQPEGNQTFNGSISGTIVPNRSDFSFNVRGQHQYTVPILNQAGSAPQVLFALKQPTDMVEAYSLFNYALTKDQTLRLGVATARQEIGNQGVGQYDGPERASSSVWYGFQTRAIQAGPIGRRTFLNSRLQLTYIDQEQHAAVEQPTIVIQDGRTTGGAQVAGGTRQTTFIFNSDLDHIRGIHSWRAGIQADGGWFDSDMNAGYLGTYTFADQASYLAGKPLLFTQTIGDPRVSYFNVQTALYLQDDIRISKSLTLSPGVRYLRQTHVHDNTGFAPRFGTTWSPFKSGHTSVRASAGLFYWPMEMARVYEQTLRYDGRHQQQVIIVNPTYPNPGSVSGAPPNKYVLGDYSLQRNLRYSLGVEQTFSPRIRGSVLYAYWHQYDFWRGENLNAPINGVRPDPAFANVIEAVTDGVIRRHDLTVNLNVSMVAPSPAANQARFNWKRMSLAATYGKVRAWQSGDGAPFTPPPTGTLDTEWAPSQNDQPYRFTASITSTQVRNVNVNLGWTANAGARYTLTTGIDDNHDGILNDRPAGVPLRSLQMPAQSTLNLRVAYQMQTGGSGGARRYRIGLNVSVNNLTNRNNYGGYSGTMTSPNFMAPTLVVNPRRADVGMTIGF